MDHDTALARLSSMVAADSAPVLTADQLNSLLTMARRPDRDGNAPRPIWQPGVIYQPGEAVVPALFNGHTYRCLIAGVSGSTEPAWSTTTNASVVDAGITWIEAGPYLWAGTYALTWAAAEGWRWKAAAVAGLYDVVLGTGYTFNRDQLSKHCLAMAAYYGRGVVGSAQVGTPTTARKHVGGLR